MSGENSPNESLYPSVELAYGFVLPSYQILVSRFEAADNRLNALLTLIVSVTTAVPLFARNVAPMVNYDATSFWAAVIAAILAIAVTVTGRVCGTVTVVDLDVLYNENLHKAQWTFQKDAIARASDHLHKNSEAVERKHFFAIMATGLMVIEVIALAVWLFV